MSSPSGSYPIKGDLGRKYYIDDAATEDAVDSEAASIVLDSDGNPLLGAVEGVQKYILPESRKIGVVGAFFLILNKMIGTGSMGIPSSPIIFMR